MRYISVIHIGTIKKLSPFINTSLPKHQETAITESPFEEAISSIGIRVTKNKEKHKSDEHKIIRDC